MLDMNDGSVIPVSCHEGIADAAKNELVLDGTTEGDTSGEVIEQPSVAIKRKEVKGIEAIHALRLANHNPAKRSKYDEEKEQKLGKLGKTKPKTILVGMEDVKNNSSMKNSSYRRQNSTASIVTRTVKDMPRSSTVLEQTTERSIRAGTKDQKHFGATSEVGWSGVW
ncbi:hypothetical protein HPP92_005713 [Vanilla planifolia]|uniref:Uncharacterized protein n=1 Tax=Vanilla planifolia TaxID=51239 RepID=A0A835RN79_VANPL|nr:hypothetical protein HPP92_005713 [Vanilla planifolia]